MTHDEENSQSAYHSLVKHEPRAETVIPPVHRAPNDTEQRLAIDQHPDPILLYHLVEARPRGSHVFEMIGHAGATPCFDADTEELGVRVGGEEVAESGEGGGGLKEDSRRGERGGRLSEAGGPRRIGREARGEVNVNRQMGEARR